MGNLVSKRRREGYMGNLVVDGLEVVAWVLLFPIWVPLALIGLATNAIKEKISSEMK